MCHTSSQGCNGAKPGDRSRVLFRWLKLPNLLPQMVVFLPRCMVVALLLRNIMLTEEMMVGWGNKDSIVQA